MTGTDTNPEQRALLGVCLMAAFADGNKSDVERDRLREIVEGFGNPNLNALGLYREVLLRQVALPQLAAVLTSPETKALAYEMALGVCEADNLLNDAEKGFLAQLRDELRLDRNVLAPLHQQADQLAGAAIPPQLGPGPAASPTTPTTTATTTATTTTTTTTTTADPELESTILQHAILAGALELLPGSLATMAIIPLQMRLVYRVGQQYGHQLDRGHIGEFLAAAGIGMASQVLEGYATKLMRGLLGQVAGALGRGLAGAVTGSAMAFGTTWAIGQLARRYYAGGRTLTGLQLQQAFQSLLGEARGLQQQYLPQIQQRRQNLNLSDVVALARAR